MSIPIFRPGQLFAGVNEVAGYIGPFGRLGFLMSLVAALGQATKRIILSTNHSRRTFTSGSDVYHELEKREIIARHESRPALLQHLADPKPSAAKSLYLGIDPTAHSLHVGHLLPLMVLLHFLEAGHTVIPLIGGATAIVGDPSGRNTARVASRLETVQNNAERLTEQLQTIFRNALEYVSKRGNHSDISSVPDVLNNASWHRELYLLDFLREVGNYAKLQTMLSKESVRGRLESQSGMLFTEFTYQLLQAYDFYKLHQMHGCTIQVGGSDQWGNILAGIELISRRLIHTPPAIHNGVPPNTSPAFGILTTLLTTSDGEKIGKTSGNAIWLDDNLTSVFEFYQYFLRTSDKDVGNLLRKFTFVPTTEIESKMQSHTSSPEMRIAQRLLAKEVTEMVHGVGGVGQAEAVSEALYGTMPSSIDSEVLFGALKGSKHLVFLHDEQLVGLRVTRLAGLYGLTSSILEAKRSLTKGGLYLNGNRLTEDHIVSYSDLLHQRFIIVRAGKYSHIVLALHGK